MNGTLAPRGYHVVKLPQIDGYRIASCVLKATSQTGSLALTPSAPMLTEAGDASMRITNANDTSGTFNGTILCTYQRI